MNERVYLSAVRILGLSACICLIGTVLCAVMDKTPPQALSVVAGTCVGAIGGLLSLPNNRPPPDQFRSAS